jgi:transposase-like protein
MLPPTPSQIGRQKLPVDREKVRMLVGEIGYTEAAKRTGIARNTLYQWNYRYKWSILPADSRSVRNVTTWPQHPQCLHLQTKFRLTRVIFDT